MAKIYGSTGEYGAGPLKAARIERTVASDQKAEREVTTAEIRQFRAEEWTLLAIGEKYGLTRTAVGYRLRSLSRPD